MLKQFQCKYCGQTYKREALFLKHNCKYANRFEVEIKTIIGQLAFQLYQEWLISKYGSCNTDIDTFIYSKNYTSFIKFSRFVQQVKLNDVHEYIKYMIGTNMPPTLWYNITVYSEYLKLYEKNTPISKQIQCSIKYLFKLADEYDCDVSNIFNHVYFNDVYDLILQRKLSLALLFKSKKFHKFINTLSEEQQQLFEKIVDFKYYKKILQDSKNNNLITTCINELQI